MKPLPHTYDISVSGGAESYAAASGAGLPAMSMAPPTEFGGPGDAWSPEHLLLTAVAACFVFTFRAVAHASNVRFDHIAVTAHGTVAKQAGAVRFTQIVLTPRISADASVDFDALRRCVDKAEDRCLVSASLSTPVRIEPDFVSIAAPAAA